ncbi:MULTISPECIES: DUF1285 domain-containing protein [Methylobacterium]|jgi:hypothetical protein|uniref:DUF1285 domain-containing protein n=1 Tax=Methylobacterium radiotolerans (strain ATCC 27329 / DSM 1819 / JCM 2831 / NBRC 15690 / NCIMB 10815 / 0-1) TaxID=426355 RepID=B1LVG4_METRJ|nr:MULTISPECIES: DUF1285 domain-containing protein [Methylobacterium]GAN47076.1 hypothetical protein ME121_1082 [Methylobacterium sp. ME121]ACB22609.1 protein of unknown function DUF1285 [Methylobacterium radiotolerans JCM 2831]KTR97400.1 hypothetical protein SB3_30975 [Methylobacterium radiotolerans]KTS46978.1 hypothetical protein SB2_14895 [Methylobacterium radiotolerans]KZC03524.1 hypothetical protein AU375_00177 [Methylobacterium radiotolerans]
MSEDPAPDPTLSRLSAALGELPKRGLPPVERWDPPYCGAIDIRIAADGTWFHNGSPIRRDKLVRLFASILRREPDGRTVLVTPVESVGITVDDAAFVAVEMAVDGSGAERRVSFRTNVDDLVSVDAEHALRFEAAPDGALKPYLHVRRGLWALVTRALTYDLVDLAEERVVDGKPWLGLWAGGAFHTIAPVAAA